jgi:hypothetical protein
VSARVIPFPAYRRRDLICSIARRVFELSPEAGEKHIRRSFDGPATVMRRKGVEEPLIAREPVGLEAAVRAVIWHAVVRREEG